jgi:hypothetical protein
VSVFENLSESFQELASDTKYTYQEISLGSIQSPFNP